MGAPTVETVGKKEIAAPAKAPNPGAELLATSPDGSLSSPLAGVEKNLLNNKYHFGVALKLKSDNKPSALVIPDVTGVTDGSSPIFITRPISLKGAHVKKFIQEKSGAGAIPQKLGDLLTDAEATCQAFYYAAKGPMLLVFDLTFNKGILSDLISADVGELFDITGASLRVLRCDEKDYAKLQASAEAVSA